MAQAPQKMSYQAVVRNFAGDPVTYHAVGMRVAILQGSATGKIVYQETYSLIPRTNANGLVSIEIGSGTPVFGKFSGIDWSDGPHYLKTEIDPTGGTNYTITGTSQLLSVPYALLSKDVQNNNDADADPVNEIQVLSKTGNVVNLSKSGGSFTDAVDDADNNPANEIQTLALSSNQLTISGSGGNKVTFTNWDTDGTDDVKLSGNQSIAGNKTFTGTINASNNTIINVADPVNPQDAATKAYVEKLLKDLGIIPNNYAGTVKDIEGNVYKTVKIGSKVWMAENLRTTNYNDGTTIPLVTDNGAWMNLATPGYSWYNNDKATYGNIYGALYNWYTVNTGKLCPTGWHVSSDAEWTTLTTFLGGESVAGGKMKEAGTSHWASPSPNTGATNESGFSGLPGGYRNWDGSFNTIGYYGYWWSSTEESTYDAWYWSLYYSYPDVTRYNATKVGGISIRCVRDF